MMSYRDVVKVNVEECVAKRDKATDEREQNYWSFIIGELMNDLRDLETGGQQRWEREPRDDAWQKYGRRIRPMNMDDIWRMFFGDQWG